MKAPVQLEFNFTFGPSIDSVNPNRKKILQRMLVEHSIGSNSSWYIFRNSRKEAKFSLGIRTFMYETEYDYIEPLTLAEALWLRFDAPSRVPDFLDCLEDFYPKPPIIRK